MSKIPDISDFLHRFSNMPELTADLILLLDTWQQAEEHGFRNHSLQQAASDQVQKMRSKYGLSAEEMIAISDNEEAFRTHLSHQSHPHNTTQAP